MVPKEVTVQTYAVSFSTVKSVHPRPYAYSWADLLDMLYTSLEMTDKHKRSLWSPVSYLPDTTRGNANVAHVNCIVFDMDSAGFDHARLDGIEYYAYTTWSHTDNDPHWHLVVPLSRPIAASVWSEYWLRFCEELNIVADPATKDPARVFFMPQHQPGITPLVRRQTGRPLEVPATLGAFVAPRPRKRRERYGDSKHFIFSEAWWNEPQDLSRFEGLTEQQVIDKLALEWRKLRETVSAT